MRRFTVAALASAVAAVAAAENSPKMEHVLVSVPIHKKTADTALPVTVLTGENLRRELASSLGDTLANQAGLHNASFGPGVGQPVIRGQQGPRVSVLQNATNSADVSGLSADHAITIEPLLADSVEVLRGPSTLLYGGGAIGGVVNVLDSRIPTRAFEGVEGAAEVRHDTAADANTGVFRVDGGNGAMMFHLDGVLRDYSNLDIPGFAEREPDMDDLDDAAKGSIPNTNGKLATFTLGSAYHWDRGFLGLAVNRLESEYGVPPGAHAHGHDDHDDDHDDHDDDDHEEEEEELVRLDIKQTRYDANLHLHEPLPGFETLRTFVTYTDYRHVEIEIEDGEREPGTRFSRKTWEGRAELVHKPIGGFDGVIGLQAQDTKFKAEGAEAYVPPSESQSLGLFLVEDYHTGAWTFEAGARVDFDSRETEVIRGSESFTSFSVSGSVLYELSPEWQLGLALMRSERAPVLEELYSNAGNEGSAEWVEHVATAAIELGDPTLDTETSRNVDVSLSWRRDRSYAQVSLFYNDFKDYIALVDTGIEVGETPVFAYRQDDAKFWGAEFDSEFVIANIGAGYLTFGVFADSVRSRLDDGSSIPRMPAQRVGGRLAYDTDDYTVWTRLTYSNDQQRPGINEDSTASWTRWDIGGDYRLTFNDRSTVDLFVRLKNITDEEIRLATSFLRDIAPEPGRAVEAGLRFRF
jgi:iron complex outermembrane receptor protein